MLDKEPQSDQLNALRYSALNTRKFALQSSHSTLIGKDARSQRFDHQLEANRHDELLAQRVHRRKILQSEEARLAADHGGEQVLVSLVGTCEDMCPEFERHERELHLDLSRFEILDGTERPSQPGEYARVDHAKAVKKYHRPAAGNEQPLPEDVRTRDALQRTMDYLVNDILTLDNVPFTEIHKFVRDRTRSIRQDFTVQNIRDGICVSIHERIARFHILSGHRLCQEPPGQFDAFQNIEQLRKVLQSLHEYYNDAYSKNLITDVNENLYSNEPEMRSYYILTHLKDSDIFRKALSFHPTVFASKEVQFALTCCAAVRDANYVRFFRLVRKASYLQACLLHEHFLHVRRDALRIMQKVYIQNEIFLLRDLIRILAFEDTNEASYFCKYHGVEVVDALNAIRFSKDAPLIESTEPFVKRRSDSLIEAKCSNSLISDIVNGKKEFPFPDTKHIKVLIPSAETMPTLSDSLSKQRSPIKTSLPISLPPVFMPKIIRKDFSCVVKPVAENILSESLTLFVKTIVLEELRTLRELTTQRQQRHHFLKSFSKKTMTDVMDQVILNILIDVAERVIARQQIISRERLIIYQKQQILHSIASSFIGSMMMQVICEIVQSISESALAQRQYNKFRRKSAFLLWRYLFLSQQRRRDTERMHQKRLLTFRNLVSELPPIPLSEKSQLQPQSSAASRTYSVSRIRFDDLDQLRAEMLQPIPLATILSKALSFDSECVHWKCIVSVPQNVSPAINWMRNKLKQGITGRSTFDVPHQYQFSTLSQFQTSQSNHEQLFVCIQELRILDARTVSKQDQKFNALSSCSGVNALIYVLSPASELNWDREKDRFLATVHLLPLNSKVPIVFVGWSTVISEKQIAMHLRPARFASSITAWKLLILNEDDRHVHNYVAWRHLLCDVFSWLCSFYRRPNLLTQNLTDLVGGQLMSTCWLPLLLRLDLLQTWRQLKKHLTIANACISVLNRYLSSLLDQVLASDGLKGEAWPAAEFCSMKQSLSFSSLEPLHLKSSTFSSLPPLTWNTDSHFSRFRSAIKQFHLSSLEADATITSEYQGVLYGSSDMYFSMYSKWLSNSSAFIGLSLDPLGRILMNSEKRNNVEFPFALVFEWISSKVISRLSSQIGPVTVKQEDWRQFCGWASNYIRQMANDSRYNEKGNIGFEKRRKTCCSHDEPKSIVPFETEAHKVSLLQSQLDEELLLQRKNFENFEKYLSSISES